MLALFFALLVLLVYSKFELAGRGILSVEVGRVRFAFAMAFLAEMFMIGLLVARNLECDSFVRAIPIPGHYLSSIQLPPSHLYSVTSTLVQREKSSDLVLGRGTS